MSQYPNPVNELSRREAANRREIVTAAPLHNLRAELSAPGSSADRATLHRALAAVFGELAVLDTIAITNQTERDDTVAGHNDTVRLLHATAEAEAARGEQRKRTPSAWTELETAAGEILDAITALGEDDNLGLALGYLELREQLHATRVTPSAALSLLQLIHNGYALQARTLGGDDELGELATSASGS